MLEHVPMRASRRARDENGRASRANDYIINRRLRGETRTFHSYPFTRREDRSRSRRGSPRVREGSVNVEEGAKPRRRRKEIARPGAEDFARSLPRGEQYVTSVICNQDL